MDDAIATGPVTAATADGVIALANERLGYGYLHAGDLNLPGTAARCATSGDEVVAYCIARQWVLREFLDRHPPLRNLGLLAHLDDETLIGHLKTVAVRRDFEKRGLARRLGLECYQILRSQHVRHFVLTAWKSDRGMHVRSIVDAGGFLRLGEISNYWAEGFDCPECGSHCRCSCVVYLRSEPD